MSPSGALTAALETSDDAVLGGRVRLAQPTTGYRAAIDPVLLAAAVPAQIHDRVLDLGCGVGTAALCLAARVPGVRVVGLEIRPEIAGLALRNAEANQVGDRVDIITGDVAAPPTACAGQAFAHVLSNPPFTAAGRGRPSPDPTKAAATVDSVGLAAWISAAKGALRPDGTLTLVHRADRLDEILAGLAGFGGVVVFPLWPGPATTEGGPGPRPAKRIIVHARKGSRAPMVLAPGLVLHRHDGAYTAATEAILSDAEGLDLTA
jgi:tRNA1(Val) A37 N6-methylase TrmN6